MIRRIPVSSILRQNEWVRVTYQLQKKDFVTQNMSTISRCREFIAIFAWCIVKIE